MNYRVKLKTEEYELIFEYVDEVIREKDAIVLIGEDDELLAYFDKNIVESIVWVKATGGLLPKKDPFADIYKQVGKNMAADLEKKILGK